MVLRLHGMEEVGVRFSLGPHLCLLEKVSFALPRMITTAFIYYFEL